MSKKKCNPSTKTPQRFYPLRDPDDPGKSRLIPVTEEFYQSVYPGIWRKRKQLQKEGKCFCPRRQLWTCDGDCDVCPFFNSDLVYLDDPISGSDGGITIGGTLVDEEADIEEILMNAELLKALAEELDRLDPNGRKTCELVGEGKAERFIADALGKPRKTYTYQRDGLFAKLREALKDYR